MLADFVTLTFASGVRSPALPIAVPPPPPPPPEPRAARFCPEVFESDGLPLPFCGGAPPPLSCGGEPPPPGGEPPPPGGEPPPPGGEPPPPGGLPPPPGGGVLSPPFPVS